MLEFCQLSCQDYLDEDSERTDDQEDIYAILDEYYEEITGEPLENVIDIDDDTKE